MGKNGKNYYADARGNQIGIFSNWLDAGPSVHGYKGNLYKGYNTLEEAKDYMRLAGFDDPPLFIDTNDIFNSSVNSSTNSEVDPNNRPDIDNNVVSSQSPSSSDDDIKTDDDNEVSFNINLPFSDEETNEMYGYSRVMINSHNQSDDEETTAKQFVADYLGDESFEIDENTANSSVRVLNNEKGYR